MHKLLRSFRWCVCLCISTLAILAAAPVYADGIGYEVAVTPTYGGTLDFFFAEPSSLDSLTTVGTMVTVESNSVVQYSGWSIIHFTQYTPVDLMIDLPNGDDWEFVGPQLFSGDGAPFTLLKGQFSISGGLYENFETTLNYSIKGGTVTAFDVPPAGTPEPSAPVLLSAGFLVVSLRFWRPRRTT